MPEEVQKDEGSQLLETKTQGIPKNPYSNLRREITEDDLASPAIQRILLSEVDKLENRFLALEDKLKNKTTELEELQKKFHEVDKERDILKEKQKISKSQEILYSFCLAAGSVIIGFAKVVWDKGLGEIFLFLGMFLIMGGIISKSLKWK